MVDVQVAQLVDKGSVPTCYAPVFPARRLDLSGDYAPLTGMSASRLDTEPPVTIRWRNS
jgi:hypothetical protein